MLRPSRCIGTAELHKGVILFDIVRFTNCHRATYMSTCEKITRTKSHVYLELTAKELPFVHTSTCMRVKKLTYFYICLLKIRPDARKKSARPTFRSEFQRYGNRAYVYKHACAGKLGTGSYLVLKIRLTYRNHAHIKCRTLDK